jgi:hypothetical protein
MPRAVRERRVDVARLGGDPLALLVLEELDRAHVVQPVGELDEDDPQVLRHGQQHLAKVLGLRRLAAVEVHHGQLGDALDERGDLLAPVLLELRRGDRGVLDHVVQQRRFQDVGVGLLAEEVEEDAGHLDGVGDVGLAALALLAFVGGPGELVGAPDLRGSGWTQILAEFGAEERLELAEGMERTRQNRSPGASAGVSPALGIGSPWG